MSAEIPLPHSGREALSDDDREDVLAFFIGMRGLTGTVFSGKVAEQIESSRRLIGKMASLHGVDSLTPAQCADILTFISCSESIEPLDWHNFESPNRVCGFMSVLGLIERSLRTFSNVPAA